MQRIEIRMLLEFIRRIKGICRGGKIPSKAYFSESNVGYFISQSTYLRKIFLKVAGSKGEGTMYDSQSELENGKKVC